MLRRVIPRLALLLLLAAGCQNYNFNPVGNCIIQPGSTSFQLSNQATADVLFVVDDSGSMEPEHARLAANFSAFMDALASAQKARQQNGLSAFDFHIAITTSSIFESWKTVLPVTCGGTGPTCDVKQSHYTQNENQLACTAAEVGEACDDVIEDYYFQTTNPSNVATYCTDPGVGTPQAAYPAGNFVAAAGNPLVLHFTKDLNWASWGTATPDSKLQTLVAQFQQNIDVGSCGSGMEQHLEAGRLAVEKALNMNGLKQPAAVAAGEWPHDGAKLVVVFVGDEDDCSNPNDPTQALAFDPANPASTTPGSDVCIEEQTTKPVSSQKLFKIADYATFFTTLPSAAGSSAYRSLGAAFIYSAQINSCTSDSSGNTTCTPGTCTCQCPPSCATCGPSAQGECQIPSDCTGKIPFLTGVGGTSIGSRFSQLSSQLRSAGASTYEASVCDADWSATLQGIANLVKPPSGLTLPTTPASSDVMVLRIQHADGTNDRYCKGPGANEDWEFVACNGQTTDGIIPTSCISINHGLGSCEANPGETYIAQYLGKVPQDGCLVAADCASALGGKVTDWTCLGASAPQTGTCVCAQ